MNDIEMLRYLVQAEDRIIEVRSGRMEKDQLHYAIMALRTVSGEVYQRIRKNDLESALRRVGKGVSTSEDERIIREELEVANP